MKAFSMAFIRFLTLISAAAVLAGCSSLPSMGGGATQTQDYAAGSALGDRLSYSARSALGEAAVSAAQSGEAQRWRAGGAAGVVMPGAYSLANLKPDPRQRIPMARADIDTAHVMETELGLYALTRNSNIRTGPGTDNSVAEVLPSGAGVDVVGRTAQGEWLLVAVDGVIRGFVFHTLAIKAPGTELALAGGPRRRPIRCREVTQRLLIETEQDEWKSALCHDGVNWRPALEVEKGEELLGL